MPDWLIRDLMFDRQVGVLYGPPGSFKSFIAHDFCARLAHGMAWQGRFLAPRRVIYVAGEGFSMFYFRRLAWFINNGLEPEDDGLDVINGAVNLTDPATVDQFIAEMAEDCDGVGLVVFDTLSTCIAGGNESDSAVISLVIEHARKISNALGAAVLLIHHPGKDEGRGARGSSALRGNIDFELRVERKELNCEIKVTKQKDGEDGQTFHYVGNKVSLDRFDSDGIERTSMAFTPLTVQPLQSQADARLEQAKVRLEADLRSICTAMTVGYPLSVNELAKKLHYLGKVRSVSDRISAAVPLEWTKTKQGDIPVTIRRAPGRGTTMMVEMEAVNREPMSAF